MLAPATTPPSTQATALATAWCAAPPPRAARWSRSRRSSAPARPASGGASPARCPCTAAGSRLACRCSGACSPTRAAATRRLERRPRARRSRCPPVRAVRRATNTLGETGGCLPAPQALRHARSGAGHQAAPHPPKSLSPPLSLLPPSQMSRSPTTTPLTRRRCLRRSSYRRVRGGRRGPHPCAQAMAGQSGAASLLLAPPCGRRAGTQTRRNPFRPARSAAAGRGLFREHRGPHPHLPRPQRHTRAAGAGAPPRLRRPPGETPRRPLRGREIPATRRAARAVPARRAGVTRT